MVAGDREREQLIGSLATELEGITEKRLIEVFKDPTGDHVEQFPLIAGRVQELAPEIWRRDPPGALIAVMRSVIEILPDGYVPKTGIELRRAASLLCGFERLPAKADGNRTAYKDYVRQVRIEVGLELPERTFRRNVTGYVRRQLATALFDVKPEEVEAAKNTASNGRFPLQADTIKQGEGGSAEGGATSNQPTNLSASATPLTDVVLSPNSFRRDRYVRRSEQETRFAELIKQGKRLIIFIGQAGAGKSWLARYITRLPDGADAPRIRLIGGAPYMSDLQAAYSSLRINARHVIGSSAENYLTHLIHCKRAPKFVLLDDLSSTDELAGLSLSGAKSIIVVTSRTEGEIPADGAETIHLGSMTHPESKALAAKLLPSLEYTEVLPLARHLAGNPSVISYACRLIACRGIGVDEFIRGFKRNPVHVAEGVHTADGATLRTVLASVVDYLRERDESAYELLTCMGLPSLSISESYFTHAFLKRYYAQIVGEGSEVAYATSLVLLQRLGLVVIMSEVDKVVMDSRVAEFIFRPSYTMHVANFSRYMAGLFDWYARNGYTPKDRDYKFALAKLIVVAATFHDIAGRESDYPEETIKLGKHIYEIIQAENMEVPYAAAFATAFFGAWKYYGPAS